jgi:hypothetical protein
MIHHIEYALPCDLDRNLEQENAPCHNMRHPNQYQVENREEKKRTTPLFLCLSTSWNAVVLSSLH